MIKIGKILVLAISTYVAFSGCTRRQTLAEVGAYRITDSDVNLRLKSTSLFDTSKKSQKTALEELIASYTLAEIIKNKKNQRLKKSIEEESRRLESITALKPKIDELKKLFGKDMAAFKRIFILPLVVDRLAFDEIYMQDEQFQQARKQRAEKFLSEVRSNPVSLESTSKKYGYMYKRGRINPAIGVINWETDPQISNPTLPSDQNTLNRWKKQVLNSTANGHVASTLIDQGTIWIALRPVTTGKASDVAKIEAVIINKEPFSEWVRSNSSNIKIKRMKMS